MVTLLMGMWLKLTIENSPAITVLLVLVNAIVIACLLFTLMKTVLGVADVHDTIRESVATVIDPVKEKRQQIMSKCQKYVSRGKVGAHAKEEGTGAKRHKIIPEEE